MGCKGRVKELIPGHNRAVKPLVSKAREFAVASHGDQRYGVHPYHVHLDDVAELAREYGEQAQIGTVQLHDALRKPGHCPFYWGDSDQVLKQMFQI